ncbi:MAG: tetratricopeptide repeat protein, partial [Endomicrobiia bacterium]
NLGFSLSYLDYGDIKGVDMYLQEYIIPKSYDMLFCISYGKQIAIEIPVYREYGYIGTSLKFIKSQLAEYSAEAISLDLSTIINIGEITRVEKIERLKASVMYKNLGSQVKFVKLQNNLPSGLNLSFGIDYPQLKNLMISSGIDIPNKGEISYSLGLSINPVYFLVLRCGYKYTHNSLSDGFTGGFGLNLGDLKFNYAVKQFKEFKTFANLGLIHQLSLDISLGGFTTIHTASEYYIKEYLNRAYELYYQKEYGLSKNMLEKIFEIHHDYKPAVLLMEKIDKKIRHQLEERENYVKNLLKKAKVSLDKKDYINAKIVYEKVLLLDSENSDAKEGLQIVQQEIAKLNQERIRQHNAKKILNLWSQGVKYYKNAELIKSKEKFEEILKIDSSNEEAKRYLTEIDTQLSKLAASQINTLYSEAMNFFNRNEYEKALKYFEAITIAAPDRLDIQEYVQKCKQKIQEEEERKKQEELTKLQQQYEKEMEDTFNSALKLYEKSDYIKALDMFNKSKAVAEKYQFAEYIKRSTDYIEEIKIVLSDIYYKEGYRLYQQNRFEEAYENYLKSLQYNPNNAAVTDQINILKESLSKKYYEIGISYYTRGETGKAKEYFKKSLYYMPDREETLRALERIK